MENSLPKKGAQVLPALMAVLVLFGGSAAEAATHTYKYFRFTPTKFRNPSTPEVQMSEFRFRLDNTVVTPTTITAPTGNSPAAETANNLKDGLLTTKWFSFAHSPLVFTFANSVSVNNYSYATGNDEEGRDPVSWTLEGSDTATTGPWTLIDVVTDFNTTIDRRVFIGDFVIPAELPPAFTFFDVTPSIVLNGKSIDFDWAASGGPVYTITPNVGDVSTLNYTPVTPPANQDTEYTVTATNSAGSLSAKHTVRSVAGGSASYRYVRFRPLAVRSATGTAIQMADFRFYGTANTDEKVPTAVYEEGGSPTEAAAEGPNKLRDGLPDTKWYSATRKNLIFDFGATQSFDTYRITTGGDAIERDPVRWILEGSADATTWTRFDDVSLFDYDVPESRKLEFSVPVPGGSLPPLVDFTSDGIKVIAGEPLKLTWATQDAASVKITPLPGTVATAGTITVTPTASADYTLTATSPAGFKTVRTIPVTVVSSPVSTIAYDSFDTENGELSLVGFASVLNDSANIPKPGNTKRLRVVPDVTGRSGAAWFSKRVPVSAGFDTTFNFMITKGDAGMGADGFAFVVQDDPAGDGALGSGEAGLPARALNIQFDTYQNTGETSAAYLRVLTGTTSQIVLNLAQVSAINLHSSTTPVSLTTARTADPHSVRISYVPGTLNMWFDGVQVIQDKALDLAAANAFNADGKALVGFTSRTGGYSAASDITSWRFSSAASTPAPLAITGYSIDAKGGHGSLTWSSIAGKTYRITTSTTLSVFSSVLSSGIVSGGDTTTKTFDFTPGSKGFFRVEESP